MFKYGNSQYVLKGESIVLNKYINKIYYLRTRNIDIIKQFADTVTYLDCVSSRLFIIPELPNCKYLHYATNIIEHLPKLPKIEIIWPWYMPRCLLIDDEPYRPVPVVSKGRTIPPRHNLDMKVPGYI